MDITKNVASLRMEFRAEKGIVNTNCIQFLDHLPEYCDWLEEKIIAAQINKESTALHTTAQLCQPQKGAASTD